MALHTADWSPLGKDVYYRKFELYSMDWQAQNLELSDFIVASAPYGGPIALIRDDRKAARIKIGSGCLIHLFSASGKTLGNIKHDAGAIVAMGWSNVESLVVIQRDGTITEYTLQGRVQTTFTMGQIPKDTGVLEARVFSTNKRTAVVILTGSYKFFLVENIASYKTWQLGDVPDLDVPPSSWTAVLDDSSTKVVVAKDDKIYVLDPRSTTRCSLETPPFKSLFNAIIEMAVSFDYKNIALFLDNGHLWAGSSDLKTVYCEIDTRTKSRPKQLLWCGRRAVVGHWNNLAFVVGMDRDYINYTFDTSIYLVQELDGARIIGNISHELLQKVPDVVTDVFRIGSIKPGALLVEASVEFEKKSYRADEYLRTVMENNELELAVQQCIDAAAHEYQPKTQKKLLRAACFGKSFVQGMNPTRFVETCRLLRVLNAVRDHMVGLPLTYTQLQCLSIDVLLDRLVLRQHYYLALKIAKYLRIPDLEGTSRILAHWACYKVAQLHIPTDEVAKAISEKLDSSPGILYSEIARKAVDCGRQDLAIKLLDCEPRASEQVPILVELGQEERALVKAIESGDTDLVYMVMLKLKEMKPTQLDMIIRAYPVAWSLYLKVCKEWDLQKLESLHDQEDNFAGIAECKIIESYKLTRPEQRIACLQAAAAKYKQGSKKGSNDFCAVQTEDQMRLMRYQLKLEDKFNDKFLDLSVHETMQRLMEIREMKLAEELCKDFKVPEKRFWWLKIKVLAKEKHWTELEKFSKSKKSPIGYEPFVDICLEHRNKFEAQKYMAKVKEENKVRYLVKIGNLEEAAKVAFEQKDEGALNFILSKCTAAERAVSDKIATMKEQLVGKR
uniref:Vacuolar protein sorting-associated protein 16 homolog n=1 Tax=Hyalomma excavatum TaxID=257692 RepID=A0A131XNR4_9ACAR